MVRMTVIHEMLEIQAVPTLSEITGKLSIRKAGLKPDIIAIIENYLKERLEPAHKLKKDKER